MFSKGRVHSISLRVNEGCHNKKRNKKKTKYLFAAVSILTVPFCPPPVDSQLPTAPADGQAHNPPLTGSWSG